LRVFNPGGTSAPFLPHQVRCRTEIMYQRGRSRLRTIDEC
jgi:hypothetical protein